MDNIDDTIKYISITLEQANNVVQDITRKILEQDAKEFKNTDIIFTTPRNTVRCVVLGVNQIINLFAFNKLLQDNTGRELRLDLLTVHPCLQKKSNIDDLKINLASSLFEEMDNYFHFDKIIFCKSEMDYVKVVYTHE